MKIALILFLLLFSVPIYADTVNQVGKYTVLNGGKQSATQEVFKLLEAACINDSVSCDVLDRGRSYSILKPFAFIKRINNSNYEIKLFNREGFSVSNEILVLKNDVKDLLTTLLVKGWYALGKPEHVIYYPQPGIVSKVWGDNFECLQTSNEDSDACLLNNFF